MDTFLLVLGIGAVCIVGVPSVPAVGATVVDGTATLLRQK
jgi:hypothetical protein